MDSEKLLELAKTSLEDLKVRDLRVLDVRGMTSVTDYLLIGSGTSSRHVSSLANKLVQIAKEAGERPIGVEGQDGGEWVLIDLDAVVVHLMQPKVREFYKLEDLWAVGGEQSSETDGA